jgi:hypothetical protein
VSRVATLACLLPLLAGCPLATISAEIPEACLVYDDVAVDGVPAGAAFTHTLVVDELPLLDGFVAIDAVLTGARVTLRARAGVSDFQFLDGIIVTVSGDDPAETPLDLVACIDGSCAAPGPETTISAALPEDLLDRTRGGGTQITLALSGTLPEQPWRSDIEVCLAGSARVTLAP